MPKTMTLDQFLVEIDDGKKFGVTFIKKTNGEIRVMNAQRRVKVGVKNDPGTNGSWNRAAQDKMHNVLTCYDSNKVDETKDENGNKGAHRRINLDGLLEAKVHGVRYRFDKATNMFIEMETE